MRRPQPQLRRRAVASCAANASFEPQTLREVVADYRAEYEDNELAERGFYRSQASLGHALRTAGHARARTGKRHPHQRRIPALVLAKCQRALLASKKSIQAARDFQELYLRVERAIGDVRGIGELMIYDTSTRLGSFLGLEPQHVYVHAGVRVGAIALGIEVAAGVIPLGKLPAPLNRLSASAAEDILCIYKTSPAFRNHAARFSQPSSVSTARNGSDRR